MLFHVTTPLQKKTSKDAQLRVLQGQEKQTCGTTLIGKNLTLSTSDNGDEPLSIIRAKNRAKKAHINRAFPEHSPESINPHRRLQSHTNIESLFHRYIADSFSITDLHVSYFTLFFILFQSKVVILWEEK